MEAEQFEVAQELQEVDEVEDVYFKRDTLRARVDYSHMVEDGSPRKTDFPKEIEEKIDEIIEGTLYQWDEYEDLDGETFRSIEHAGRGHPRPHGDHWYVVLEYRY